MATVHHQFDVVGKVFLDAFRCEVGWNILADVTELVTKVLFLYALRREVSWNGDETLGNIASALGISFYRVQRF